MKTEMMPKPPLAARVSTWVLDSDGVMGGFLAATVLAMYVCLMSLGLTLWLPTDLFVPWAWAGGVVAVLLVATVAATVVIEHEALGALRSAEPLVIDAGNRGHRAFTALAPSDQVQYRHLLLDLKAATMAAAQHPEDHALALRVYQRADALEDLLLATQRLNAAVLGDEGLRDAREATRLLNEVSDGLRPPRQ